MLDADYNISDIVNAVGRSRGTVYSVLNSRTKICASPRSGKPLSVSDFSIRCMMRKPRKELATTRMEKTASNSLLYVQRICQYKQRQKFDLQENS